MTCTVTICITDDKALSSFPDDMGGKFDAYENVDKEYLRQIFNADATRLKVGDSITYTFVDNHARTLSEIPLGVNITKRALRAKPPKIGKLLICLCLSHDKHEDRLADFEEMLRTIWIPQFGTRVGRLIYVWHALRSAGAIIHIGLVAAVADRIARKFGW